MKSTKIALIIPVKGSLPPYFKLFLEHLSFQRNINTLLIGAIDIDQKLLPPNVRSLYHNFNEDVGIIQSILSEQTDFILSHNYWTIGSLHHLYGNLYRFIFQLTKDNPDQFELSSEKLRLTFYKATPQMIENVITNNFPNNLKINTITDVVASIDEKHIYSFNQGRIFNYFNRRAYAFLDCKSFKEDVYLSATNWKTIPPQFYITPTGFYSIKEFRNYKTLKLQKQLKNLGLRCVTSVRKLIGSPVLGYQLHSSSPQQTSE
ncbi:hypothetical protein [Flammeovirga kamogawensis]|uniref:Uncharacterized protein n=1 Tax=Flammeovirga kamogawensis TaxID=373891 RepID=A0ABX8GTG9_9BACT|nr:hypothetical protein [Flammeovirga kamogawensis]MBB6463904.1 hypothetical protein [Flammeovirga kamogawensis]QWG06572.1 hypothetical protein KM029_14770 [Flammeovirga kamogawensis]TRX68398.1 hypothetical protein EO216_09770 [Flammeovirga kamogawensis]